MVLRDSQPYLRGKISFVSAHTGRGRRKKKLLLHNTIACWFSHGANENTNGLLRQYFPKGTPLSEFDQADLNAVADSLNARPRKTLDYATPGEQFTNLLAGLAGAQKSPSGGVRPGT